MHELPFSTRLKLLWEIAHIEEGTPTGQVSVSEQCKLVSLYPRSFVDRVSKMSSKKKYDFSFCGAMKIDAETEKNRRWVLDFARSRFTDRSYFQATDSQSRNSKWENIGVFDFTKSKRGFVPKEQPREKRAYFDQQYFRVLRQSNFVLCPAGDAPWSMRFFETILAGSIPILQSRAHRARNVAEADIGYRFFLASDKSFCFDAKIVDDNLRLFMSNQTLI